jgi:hypothetical protein
MKIPDQIASDPAIRAVLEQQLPGVYVQEGAEYPIVEEIERSPKSVTDDLGLAFYRSKDETRTAVFNPLVVSPDEVKQADEEGSLDQIFPEYGQVVGSAPGGEEAPPMPGAPSMPAPVPAGPPPSPADKLRAMTPPTPPGASNLIGAMQAPTI